MFLKNVFLEVFSIFIFRWDLFLSPTFTLPEKITAISKVLWQLLKMNSVFRYSAVCLLFCNSVLYFLFFIKTLTRQDSEKSNQLIVLGRRHKPVVLDRKDKNGGEWRGSDDYRQYRRIHQRWKQSCKVVLTYCFHFVRHCCSCNTKDKYNWLFHHANQNERYM